MQIKSGQYAFLEKELIEILEIQNIGSYVRLEYTSLTNNQQASRVLPLSDAAALESFDKHSFGADHRFFKLYVEARRLASAYRFDPLFAVNCSVVDPLPHQLEAVYKYLLPQPQIRFLLADDTGAGKTIMAGLLLKEMMMRKLCDRVLIITPGGLTKQWQEDELQLKFNLQFQLLDRMSYNSNPNIFMDSKCLVTSIDFISQDDIREQASQHHWDMIIFDEAHKLSAYEYGRRTYRSRRYRLAECLASRSEHLLLLTATPHRGRKDTFRKLLQLLDADIFVSDELTKQRVQEETDGVNKFFIRRLKEEMKDWDGQPLYKDRYTQTVSYSLSKAEKELYDAVTHYLVRQKEEASANRNIHVALALSVMQRRLVSSIYAIKKTLEKRYLNLKYLVDVLAKQPELWNKKYKLENYDLGSIDDYDDLEDNERALLEDIANDPKKLRLFTTAPDMKSLRKEAAEVQVLFNMANDLFSARTEESKYKQLKALLEEKHVIEGRKLVLFTEHKDTLDYLYERLSKEGGGGYNVVTIHGGKSVDERRRAQLEFRKADTPILIATDAAGEGINLQFCSLLINWDIPWNPNRLEQRMGRIHRYGQKEDVLVVNMVASNSREGKVLGRLLEKLDSIRQSIGDDRVYDVIQDVFEEAKLADIIAATLDGEENDFTDLLKDEKEPQLKLKFEEKIKEQKEQLKHSLINYKQAAALKDASDEQRLQPLYIQHFFESGLAALGGKLEQLKNNIYKLTDLPKSLSKVLRERHKRNPEAYLKKRYCFDKSIFLAEREIRLGKGEELDYLNPGHILYDALLALLLEKGLAHAIKGCVLVDPQAEHPRLYHFVSSQVVNNLPSRGGDQLVDEELYLFYQDEDGKWQRSSAAKLLDCMPVGKTAFPEDIPTIKESDILTACFEEYTLPQVEKVEKHIGEDMRNRKAYLKASFQEAEYELLFKLNDCQSKLLDGNKQAIQKYDDLQKEMKQLEERKTQRLERLDELAKILPQYPQLLATAYLLPLTASDDPKGFQMRSSKSVENCAMQLVIKAEEAAGRKAEDVSMQNLGYDIRSIDEEGQMRCIEVKGRATEDGIMLSENEKRRLAHLGAKAWLYIVVNCSPAATAEPEIYRFQDPCRLLQFEKRVKNVQYYLPLANWKAKL
ncbi:DNA/RNA helicase, superfamily II [Saprospira grandis DSM 2844]|uniref:DNA/RNA helicase, superfamily II n=1 Tax=Saprospira grandis DSM 2844 TaxID=694433 RepID=J0P4P5_9BACT|nr:helicase-related protein [Saprospira grandis]EJF54824.1 DNA/RNA helicase, superfamily II [Saprospira grandis DSM 2844]